jgi:hypothetical protein
MARLDQASGTAPNKLDLVLLTLVTCEFLYKLRYIAPSYPVFNAGFLTDTTSIDLGRHRMSRMSSLFPPLQNEPADLFGSLREHFSLGWCLVERQLERK